MPPSPPAEASLEVLPKDELSLVLSHTTIAKRCQVVCLSRGLRDAAYGSPELWQHLEIRPQKMSAEEIDSLVKRAGGTLKTLKLVLYRRQSGHNSIPHVPWRLENRSQWTVALQSLCANKSLESIEFWAPEGNPAYDAAERGRPSQASAQISNARCAAVNACAGNAMDALCAIAAELPLSLKKIKIARFAGSEIMFGGAQIHHIRAIELAPCCTDGDDDGKCELDVCVSCEDCGDITLKKYAQPKCSVCQGTLMCEMCSDMAAESGSRCLTCTQVVCHRAACQAAVEFPDCEACFNHSPNVCSDCCAKAPAPPCVSCGVEVCARDCPGIAARCGHEGCDVVECHDCFDEGGRADNTHIVQCEGTGRPYGRVGNCRNARCFDHDTDFTFIESETRMPFFQCKTCRPPTPPRQRVVAQKPRIVKGKSTLDNIAGAGPD